MKFSQVVSTFLIFIFSQSLSHAEETKVVQDFRLNTSLGVEKSLFNSWKVSLGTTLKLEKNATLIDELDFDLDIEYSPFDFLSLGAGYRFAHNRKTSGMYAQKHRYSGDVKLIYGFQRFKFDYRIRYQNVDDDFFLYETNKVPQNILRNRIQVKYNIRKSKITPFLFTEYYGVLSSYLPFGMKIKTGVGARYNLKKYGKVKVYYRIDRELNVPFPYTYYTVGAGYTYDF